MNTDWFKQQLAARKLSQRGLAKLLDVDPAAVSLMFRGQRRMTNPEAHQLSTILGVPITEVLRQAGIEVIDDVRRVPIAGYADEAGMVSLMPAGTHEHVVGPADCPAGTVAIQMRSPTSIKDGWLLFVSPAQMEPSVHMDQLCSVALANGKQVVAVLRRGYRRGTHNLVVWPSDSVMSDVEVVWAAPVLWIKPH